LRSRDIVDDARTIFSLNIAKSRHIEEMELKMQNVKFKKFVIAVGAAIVASTACAEDATVGVSATIRPECAVTGTTLTFTKLTMLNTATANQSDQDDVQAGTVRAICTNGTANVKFIYTSANPNGNDFQLRGTDGLTMIKYSLHQDTSATAGNQVSSGGLGVAHPAFSANGEAQDLPIAARVQAADKRAKKVQSYSDTITVTTSFDA
jgi:hypothetical protein